MAEIKNIFIVCGEPSGDLLAGNLVAAMQKLNPQIKFAGVGGWQLAKTQTEIFCNISELSVMGFFDVLKKLPKFLALKNLILDKIRVEKPDAIIFVDFSGFNLRLARAINNTIPTIYYVSPQVWASRRGRVKTIKKYIRKMIVLFEFEREFYKQCGMDAEFTGHPLLDIVKSKAPRECSQTTIALLPGSRKQEIKRILPIMLESARIINQEIPARFIIAKAPGIDKRVYNEIISKLKVKAEIEEDKTYACLNQSDFALVCSGTATLETAILEKPFVIIYKTSFLNYLLYRPLIKVPYIGIVNIMAGKKIIPEFIQFGASPKKIAKQALEILTDPAKLQNVKTELAKIKSSLGEPGASARAAKLILDFLRNK
jgi:lipid-A-disaccharide synthase